MKGVVRLMLRLPDDQKAFVEREAQRNGSSQNSEIIRCVRERMDRMLTTDTAAPAGK
ncbi:Arc family DNA-binding protein [Rhizobium leguminosarum]|uniref:Arc family DNA-binding protein n=1 Tax=Rhizobium ruizarguesonis TaxID=2081791 RepID=UPI0013B93085|nr:Arc family DNA-binding protein [Rhizobium ruizarguesonis]NEH87747.1 Arc family DNA-binding protein [Rhizobium ruizarguesonis]NEJ60277.1 Arc family DNA-binding protein [Rhizobium ruizarguesonis]NEJ67353.1 Arc family DNA-binding protein [Rhizobium ruizarguesonis]NEK04301.1 Arc family DNA-binding protein [Rhizobium ruizarguesonis]